MMPKDNTGSVQFGNIYKYFMCTFYKEDSNI
jgi:hypothetical protein